MSFKKMPIFTSGALPLGKQTSQQFQAFGATGAPTSIGQLSITMVKTKINFAVTLALSQLWAWVAATITKSDSFDAEPITLPKATESYDMSTRPALVITINPKSSENKIQALQNAG